MASNKQYARKRSERNAKAALHGTLDEDTGTCTRMEGIAELSSGIATGVSTRRIVSVVEIHWRI
jgi:hypothetical protein